MEKLRPNPDVIGELYDEQSEEYSVYNSFSWNYIEKPAIRRYLELFVSSNSKILDIGTGTGRVVGLLIEMGANPKNITGVDVSKNLLAKAKREYPKTTFIHASADNSEFSPETFDIVTANMVFHYMDDEALFQAMKNIYKFLKPYGKLCHVDTHPIRSDEAKKAENNDKWIVEKTPWGGEIPIFNRAPYSLVDITDFSGFGYEGGWETLPVSADAKAQAECFKHYSNRPARSGYLWVKLDEAFKRSMREPT